MKKLTLLFVILLVVAATAPVLAHEANREPVFKIFGIAEPSLLPDSGFYFFKEMSRGFKRIFTFDAVKKAELELEIADEKLAELEKVASKSEALEDAIKDAFENYLEAHERLAKRLESLKGKNKNVDTLLAKLADRVIEHQELFNALEDKFKKEETEKATKEIAKVVKKATELDKEKFKEKIKARIEKDKEDDEEELEALEELIEDIFEADDEKENLNQTLEDIRKSNAFRELEKSRQENESYLSAKVDLEESKALIGSYKVMIKKVKLIGKDLAEANHLLDEAVKHWGFAKSEFEKRNPRQAKVHTDHVDDFLQSLYDLLERNGVNPEDLWLQLSGGDFCFNQGYAPVCGADGEIYRNECSAKALGTDVKHKGMCEI